MCSLNGARMCKNDSFWQISCVQRPFAVNNCSIWFSATFRFHDSGNNNAQKLLWTIHIALGSHTAHCKPFVRYRIRQSRNCDAIDKYLRLFRSTHASLQYRWEINYSFLLAAEMQWTFDGDGHQTVRTISLMQTTCTRSAMPATDFLSSISLDCQTLTGDQSMQLSRRTESKVSIKTNGCCALCCSVGGHTLKNVKRKQQKL